MSQPGSVLSYIVNGQADALKGIRHEMNSFAEIAQTTNETSMATIDPTSLPERSRGPCIMTTRLLFLPMDSEPLKVSCRQVPSWVNPLSFETLRRRYHSSEQHVSYQSHTHTHTPDCIVAVFAHSSLFSSTVVSACHNPIVGRTTSGFEFQQLSSYYYG
jgi:hypothetical protein